MVLSATDNAFHKIMLNLQASLNRYDGRRRQNPTGLPCVWGGSKGFGFKPRGRLQKGLFLCVCLPNYAG